MKSYERTPEIRKKLSIFWKGKRQGVNNPHWKGGKRKAGENGEYVAIFSPEHPYANKDGAVLEHRLIMEKHLGRILLPTEIVHHINNNAKDNRIENLMLFSNQNEHAKSHYKHDKKGHYTKED